MHLSDTHAHLPCSQITINGLKRKYSCNWIRFEVNCFSGVLSPSPSLFTIKHQPQALKVQMITWKWFRFHYVSFVCWFYGGTVYGKKREVKYEARICGYKQKWHYHLTFIHCYFTPCTLKLFVVQHSITQNNAVWVLRLCAPNNLCTQHRARELEKRQEAGQGRGRKFIVCTNKPDEKYNTVIVLNFRIFSKTSTYTVNAMKNETIAVLNVFVSSTIIKSTLSFEAFHIWGSSSTQSKWLCVLYVVCVLRAMCMRLIQSENMSQNNERSGAY